MFYRVGGTRASAHLFIYLFNICIIIYYLFTDIYGRIKQTSTASSNCPGSRTGSLVVEHVGAGLNPPTDPPQSLRRSSMRLVSLKSGGIRGTKFRSTPRALDTPVDCSKGALPSVLQPYLEQLAPILDDNCATFPTPLYNNLYKYEYWHVLTFCTPTTYLYITFLNHRTVSSSPAFSSTLQQHGLDC